MQFKIKNKKRMIIFLLFLTATALYLFLSIKERESTIPELIKNIPADYESSEFYKYTYSVSLNNILPLASATIEMDKNTDKKDGYSHLIAKATSTRLIWLQAKSMAESLVKMPDFIPLKFTEETTLPYRPIIKKEVNFNHKALTLTSNKGTYAIHENTKDPLSLFFLLVNSRFQEGAKYYINTNQSNYLFHVKGVSREEYTAGKHKFNVIRLDFIIGREDLTETKFRGTVWYISGKHNLPIKAEVYFDNRRIVSLLRIIN